MLIDTHSHIYLQEFEHDRAEVVERAKLARVQKIILPNVDLETVEPLVQLATSDKNLFFTANGLHPTSVNADYKEQIKSLFSQENLSKFPQLIAIGEIGIDLYWDTTYLKEQKLVFDYQLNFACRNNLPVIIHCRNGFHEIIDVLESYKNTNLSGVFHCFSEDFEAAKKVLDRGFLLGIGGVLTYKKSLLPEIIKNVPLQSVILETDSPYLPPVPYRGKRNEPAYIIKVAEKLAEIHQKQLPEIFHITTTNVFRLFGI